MISRILSAYQTVIRRQNFYCSENRGKSRNPVPVFFFWKTAICAVTSHILIEHCGQLSSRMHEQHHMFLMVRVSNTQHVELSTVEWVEEKVEALDRCWLGGARGILSFRSTGLYIFSLSLPVSFFLLLSLSLTKSPLLFSFSVVYLIPFSSLYTLLRRQSRRVASVFRHEARDSCLFV